MQAQAQVQVRKSWKNQKEHYISVLSDPWYRLLVDIQDTISTSTFRFYHQRGLKNLHLPITTSSISSPMGMGSDSQPVKVKLFGVDTFLADSMQFMLEFGCRFHAPGCYYLMPSFRGEASDETHLCQFYHSEAEIVGNREDVMRMVEEYLRYMSSAILDQCGDQIARIAGDVLHIETLTESSDPLPQVTMDEAVSFLGDDLLLVKHCEPGYRVITRKGERRLIEEFGGFVWITNPDHLAVPFYQAFADKGQRSAKAADLLFGLGEVVGAGERHATAELLEQALEMHEVDKGPYEWYIKIRENHPIQTSGFGLGTERYIAWLLRHDDVRDCQLLPRFNGELAIP
jgi:asparaginyl-tRNA synthetase